MPIPGAIAPARMRLPDVRRVYNQTKSIQKVPGSELGGLEGDAPARTIIEAQNQKIAEQAGRRRAPIKSIARSRGR